VSQDDLTNGMCVNIYDQRGGEEEKICEVGRCRLFPA
jgi:hypothetical protein